MSIKIGYVDELYKNQVSLISTIDKSV